MRDMHRLFIGEDYNIFKDKVERVIPEDPRILVEVYVAYCLIQRVKGAHHSTKLRNELDMIHTDLVERIAKLEPIRPTGDNSQGHSSSSTS